jgi:prevent-host-death family protein
MSPAHFSSNCNAELGNPARVKVRKVQPNGLDCLVIVRWQIQEAKQRFSELINRAQRDGPQVVTRHGSEVAVVIAAEEFHRLSKDKGAFKDFLSSGPDWDMLDLPRDRTPARTVSLTDSATSRR